MKSISFKPKHNFIICTGQLPLKLEGRRFIVGFDGEKIETKTTDTFLKKLKSFLFIKDVDGQD